MMVAWADLSWSQWIVLVLALGLACVFEFANGFHDTANAVATVIYTHSLKPRTAVIWSGICNFAGVFVGGIGVAMSIVYLLPAELLVAQGVGPGLTVVIAILGGAILWNVGTWFFGIPASSSHALIGAILGVGLANSLLPGHTFGSGVNWGKAREIFVSLLISPLLGFWLGAALLAGLKSIRSAQPLFETPHGQRRPPRKTRALLVATCTGVSFVHGSNDGQKGVGLVLLILIGAVPAAFCVNPQTTPLAWSGARNSVESIFDRLTRVPEDSRGQVKEEMATLRQILGAHPGVSDLNKDEKWQVRKAIVELGRDLKKLEPYQGPEGERLLKSDLAPLRKLIEFAPTWVILMVALSLGLGTMVGWRRIVVTVGERIGKSHLNYAQGASAETVAMSMIGFAAWAGVPVSTTHVLSSAVTGTMVAQKAGVQKGTVSKIALAWVFTLPATIMLSGALFLFLRAVVTSM